MLKITRPWPRNAGLLLSCEKRFQENCLENSICIWRLAHAICSFSHRIHSLVAYSISQQCFRVSTKADYFRSWTFKLYLAVKGAHDRRKIAEVTCILHNIVIIYVYIYILTHIIIIVQTCTYCIHLYYIHILSHINRYYHIMINCCTSSGFRSQCCQEQRDDALPGFYCLVSSDEVRATCHAWLVKKSKMRRIDGSNMEVI